MSKMSELSQVLDEMVSCGENLIQAAKALKDIFSSTEEEKKSVSLEDVRAVLAEKSRRGFTEEVKEIISKHGQTDFPALIRPNMNPYFQKLR